MWNKCASCGDQWPTGYIYFLCSFVKGTIKNAHLKFSSAFQEKLLCLLAIIMVDYLTAKKYMIPFYV
ncbi:hypothetical protein BTJ40_20895 [Microbulbifer sp. A4B17]|nr:hypothetical protein BTJ40_20895 [Microbulbifer sp. A4B17]